MENAEKTLHRFDYREAEAYGLEEAIVIHRLRSWILHNRKHGKNQRDGRTWTFNTYAAWAEYFPYFSPTKMRRILDSLVEQGVLLKSQLDKTSGNATNHYAFQDENRFLVSLSDPLLKTTDGLAKSTEALSESAEGLLKTTDGLAKSTDVIGTTGNPINNTRDEDAGAPDPAIPVEIPRYRVRLVESTPQAAAEPAPSPTPAGPLENAPPPMVEYTVPELCAAVAGFWQLGITSAVLTNLRELLHQAALTGNPLTLADLREISQRGMDWLASAEGAKYHPSWNVFHRAAVEMASDRQKAVHREAARKAEEARREAEQRRLPVTSPSAVYDPTAPVLPVEERRRLLAAGLAAHQAERAAARAAKAAQNQAPNSTPGTAAN